MTQDTILPIVVENSQHSLRLMDLILSGGIGGNLVMLILFFCSIITITIFIERWIIIKQATKMDYFFIEDIKRKIMEGDLQMAIVFLKQQDSMYSRLITKGVERIGKPLADISGSITNAGKLELFQLEKNLSILATISGVAPMIGFLGTVIGMVIAFYEMANAGGQINVEMLSQGIYTAMITTVAGLIVGISAYVAYNFLVVKVDKIVHKMETIATDFLDLLNKPIN